MVWLTVHHVLGVHYVVSNLYIVFSTVHHVHELVNVIQRVVDNVDLGHLLVDGGGGDGPPQRLVGRVDRLHAVALACVTLNRAQVLLHGLHGVAVNWVVGH